MRSLALTAALLPAMLSACAAAPEGPASCPLAGQEPMVQIELFFGRDIAGQATVSDQDWEAFYAGVLSKEFPDGSTALVDQGRWLDPQTNQLVHEPGFLVLISVPRGSRFEEKIGRIVDAYKSRFDQQSVGVVTEAVCARF